MELKVLGIDPSLSNFGYAFGRYLDSTNSVEINRVSVESPTVITSKQVRQNNKDLDRAQQLSNSLLDNLRAWKPDAVFIEVPVGSKSARAMASYGICIGVIASAKHRTPVPFYEVTPTQVKLFVSGSKKASKQEIIDWAVNKYPNVNWPYKIIKGQKSIITGQAEHMADAVAAIHAGILNCNDFSNVLHFLRNRK